MSCYVPVFLLDERNGPLINIKTFIFAMIDLEKHPDVKQLLAKTDEYTLGHCLRVSRICELVGRALEFDDHHLNVIVWSGLLHDIGKIDVPREITLKPGKLTLEEFNTMQAHVAYSYEHVLSLDIPNVDIVAEIVLHHHERYDGKGYLGRFQADDIPHLSKIISIVDVYDAIRSRRSYHHDLPHFSTLAIIHADMGQAFDPAVFKEVVPILTKLHEEHHKELYPE